MPKSLFLFFLLFSGLVLAQLKTKIYHEAITDGAIVYVDNDEYSPVSVHFTFNLDNFSSSEGKDFVFVAEPGKSRQKVTILTFIKKAKSGGFNYDTRYNIGDHRIKIPDPAFVYNLPYKKGETYRIYQGYDGRFSHQNENSLDFSMDEGSEIRAVRDGIVVETEDSNTKNCPQRECMQFNNYVRIYHADGTFAEYSHIKKNGAKVKAGDRVKAGDIIALSGNTGWSDGPHLHLVIFLQYMDERRTLRTKFKTGKGEKAEYLKEGLSYSRDY